MLVDSKKKQLGQEAIVMIAAQETKSPHPASTIYAAMVPKIIRCTKGLQIDIEHWDQHWNIENIDIDIDIE